MCTLHGQHLVDSNAVALGHSFNSAVLAFSWESFNQLGQVPVKLMLTGCMAGDMLRLQRMLYL